VDPVKKLRRSLKQQHADYIESRAQKDLAEVQALEPRVLDAYQFISKQSGSVSREPIFRAADLIAWLGRLQPKTIQELGSGRSSVVFAAWCAKNGAQHIAYEQRDYWRDIVEEAISIAGGLGTVVHVPMVRVGGIGAKFTKVLAAEIDLVYVDGPSGEDRTYHTHDGRCINMDVPEHLRAGHRPKAILIDGRQNTRDLLWGMPEAHEYELTKQFQRTPEFASATDYVRHSSMLLRAR